jgi:hypothetical protein
MRSLVDRLAGCLLLVAALAGSSTFPADAPEPGMFDTPASPALTTLIKRRVETAPEDMHYYDGRCPERISAGSAWPGANFTQVRAPTEVAPGFWLFPTQSDTAGTREMNEISLAIKTPHGIVLMVGCAHPGIENVLDIASRIDPHIFTVCGGFHLVDRPDAEVTHMRFDHAGVGSVIGLPSYRSATAAPPYLTCRPPPDDPTSTGSPSASQPAGHSTLPLRMGTRNR